MRLTCPTCGTNYNVDASEFPQQGRIVRCHKCEAEWRQLPDDMISDLEHQNAKSEQTNPPENKERQLLLQTRESLAFHFFAYSVICLVLISAYQYREPLRDRLQEILSPTSFEKSADIDNTADDRPTTTQPDAKEMQHSVTIVGDLNHNGDNQSLFEIVSPTYDFEPLDSGGRALIVSGDVVNNGAESAAAPYIIIKIFDADGMEILRWKTVAAPENINAGSTGNFTSRLVYPPDEIGQITVTLE